MAVGGLYNTPDAAGRALQGYQGAAATYGAMDKKRPGQPGPSAGGAIQSTASGAMMGAGVGMMMAESIAATGPLAAVGGPIPLAIGAGVGLLSYLL